MRQFRNWKPDITLTCRCQEDRQRQPFAAPSTAEIAILAFLHIRRQIGSNPAAFAVKDAAFLEVLHRSLAAFDCGGMMRVFNSILTLGLWKRNRPHRHILALWQRQEPQGEEKLAVLTRLNKFRVGFSAKKASYSVGALPL